MENDNSALQEPSSSTPLLISPLFHHENDEKSVCDGETTGRFQTIQRLVTSAPNAAMDREAGVNLGEIETSLEEYVAPNRACLWRRIVVRGGPGRGDGAARFVHASFNLPTSGDRRHASVGVETAQAGTLPGESTFCWASFRDRPNHKLLCVLSTPSLLCIWDVYPAQGDGASEGGEGHSVTLPFEACAIYALGENHGLLLQRKDTPDDQFLYDSMKESPWLGEDMAEDGGFVLTEPPKPRRLGNMLSPSASGQPLDAHASTPSSREDHAFAAVPSLFSLHHALDEVLPVATMPSGTNQDMTLMSDVYEKLIFVGTPSWTDYSVDVSQQKFHSQPICVTYHTRLNRHAVWTLKSAPPPPPTPPLWQISRNQRINIGTSKGTDNNMSLAEHASRIVDDGDLEMIGATDTDMSQDDGNIPHITRQEALADALGVRPTMKVEDTASTRPRTGVTGSRSRRSGNLSGPPSSFLSPPPVSADSRTYLTDRQETSATDISTRDPDGAPHHIAGQLLEASLSTSPFANLHPDAAMNLVYEEEPSIDGHRAQASEVFLASNSDGSGSLVLCLVCPVDDEVNPAILHCLSLNVKSYSQDAESRSDVSSLAIERQGHSFTLSPLTSIPCKSAQPIQAIPKAPGFRLRRGEVDPCCVNEPLATDILILMNKRDFRRRKQGIAESMSLYRCGLPVVDCVLASPWKGEGVKIGSPASRENAHARVVGIANAVVDRADFFCESEEGEEVIVRGTLSLAMSSSCLTERTLGAIESGLIIATQTSPQSDVSQIPFEIELSLKMRADCKRMSQDICDGADGDASVVEDPAWRSVSTVISSILDYSIGYGHEGVHNASKPSNMTRKNSDNNDDAAWTYLMNSDFHRNYVSDHDPLVFLSHQPIKEDTLSTMSGPGDSSMMYVSLECLRQGNSDTTAFASCIFDSLHLLYEDCKLSRTSRSGSWLQAIGSLLVSVCARIDRVSSLSDTEDRLEPSSMCDFMDHYRRDLGGDFIEKTLSSVGDLSYPFCLRSEPDFYRRLITSFTRPPCFLSWVEDIMKGSSNEKTQTNIFFANGTAKFNPACSVTCSLHHILSILFASDQHRSGSSPLTQERHQAKRDVATINALIDRGMVDPSELRDELPVGIALPLLETLHRCRGDPLFASNSDLPSSAWSLIGRGDLCQRFGSGSSIRSPPLVVKDAISKPLKTRRLSTEGLQSMDDDEDGIISLEITSSMRFPNDNRVHEAGRLLRSSRPSYLRVARAVEVSDHDFERLKQEKLLVLSRRVLSLPLGRGMLTLGTLQPVPAEPMPVPDLCLSGRVPPTNATLALDVTSCPSDMKVWPDFHNGVAAGLRLPDAGNRKDVSASVITRTWIVYNKPDSREPEATPSNGNSPNNGSGESSTHHAHGGLLMALGLRGHLSVLSMTDIYDYLTEGTVTTTVGLLLGMAANKRGSCDPSISKMLCLHIPSLLPPSFSAIDVASPAQSAAVAGVGLLYQRSSHRLMTEFLLNEMAKRPTNDTSTCDREAYALSCGLALGMVNLSRGDQIDGKNREAGGNAGLADLHIEERLYRYIVGGVDDSETHRRREAADRVSTSTGVEHERCSRTFEGGTINTGVTAPGAILALGLMYLQSGNKSVASSLSLPDTNFLLEYVRPDLLLLRVISYSLILWDDVLPFAEWIEDQVPEVVRRSIAMMRTAAEKVSRVSVYDPNNMDEHFVAGNETVQTGKPTFPEESEAFAEIEEQEVDRQAIRQIYAHVVAGACFSIGLRFAGTGDKRAASAVCDRVKFFLKLRDDPSSLALKPEQSILEMCLGCSAVALAMVMAGTGDLDTLKVLKMLRWRCDDVKHGNHMAYGAAIGLLFLGGGNCTLGREPEDIAALVLAFFPRFPSTSSDNQYHLQALRHCYVLAVKRRGLHAVDVDTREEVFVPVEIDLKDQKRPVCLSTPCLVQNTFDTPKQLRVVSDRYHPLSLNIDEPRFFDSGTFFVKKRSGYLSYFQDPHAQRSLSLQSGSSSWYSALELIRSFTADPRILAYARYLCDNDGATPRTRTQYGCQDFSISNFCTEILHECLTNDKEEAMQLYLSLRSSVESLESQSADSVKTIWDVRLTRAYYEQCHRFIEGYSDSRVLNTAFVSVLSEMVDYFLTDKLSLDDSDNVGQSSEYWGCFLTWHRIPLQQSRLNSTSSGVGMMLA